jgi:hypothetical protein
VQEIVDGIMAGSFAIRQSKTTEGQRIGNQINAAFIFARADFVNVNRGPIRRGNHGFRQFTIPREMALL